MKATKYQAAIFLVVFLAILSAHLSCGKAPKQNQGGSATQARPGSDIVLESATAASNAATFGRPPDGWSVVCDDHGHYAPAYLGYAFDIPDLPGYRMTVRDTFQEAVVACWQVKEVLDRPHEPEPGPSLHTTNKWKECDK